MLEVFNAGKLVAVYCRQDVPAIVPQMGMRGDVALCYCTIKTFLRIAVGLCCSSIVWEIEAVAY